MVEITRYCLVLTTRHNNSSLSYSYDAVGELTGATGTLNGSNYSVSYSYDLNGNRTMAGYQTGTGNELLSDGTYNYTYDKDGNLVSQTNIATGSVTYYTWDYRNRLIEVKQESSNGTVLNDEKFTYDVNNNRIAVSLNGTPELYTVYDGANPYMDFNGSGQLTERYLYNPNALSQFYGQVSASGTVQWFLTDNINSVRQVVSSGGTVLDAITYDPYGNILSQTNAANAPRFLYAGGAYDSLTGYDQFGRRYYDSSDGRWTSQDPMGFKAGDTDLYRYVYNQPTYRIDPSGLESPGGGLGYGSLGYGSLVSPPYSKSSFSEVDWERMDMYYNKYVTAAVLTELTVKAYIIHCEAQINKEKGDKSRFTWYWNHFAGIHYDERKQIAEYQLAQLRKARLIIIFNKRYSEEQVKWAQKYISWMRSWALKFEDGMNSIEGGYNYGAYKVPLYPPPSLDPPPSLR